MEAIIALSHRDAVTTTRRVPARPKLLFVTRVMPDHGGSGVSMRAGAILQWLAPRFEVTLLLIPIYGLNPRKALSPLARECCARVEIFPVLDKVDPAYRDLVADARPGRSLRAYAYYPKPLPWRFATEENVAAAARRLQGVHFDAVHVFRLFMAPFAAPFLDGGNGARAFRFLDLDEFQSRTRLRLAALYERVGMSVPADIERVQAARFAEMETRYIAAFDRVGLAAERDAAEVAAAHGGADAVWVPNVIRQPNQVMERRPNEEFTFLFVGILNWFPNEDAVVFFCLEILPLLRERAGRPLRVEIIGAGASRRLAELGAIPEVRLRGRVPDLGPAYAAADAVIVPLRAGGGTRIKILEAAANGAPVVSTTPGAEGLTVISGESILIGDDAEDFAARCLDLIRNPALGRSLARKAGEWVRREHDPSRLDDALSDCYSPVAGGRD